MGKSKRWALLVIGVVMALTVSACSGDSGSGSDTTAASGGSDTTQATDTTVGGGGGGDGDGGGDGGFEAIEVSRWSGPGPVETLDPSLIATAAGAVATEVFAGKLFRFDENSNPQMDLADSFETSEDGTEVTITIRPDAVYDDGTPVTADDFRFAWERAKDSRAASDVTPIEDIEVVDEKAAVVHLIAPFPDFTQLLSTRVLSLHPRSQVEGNDSYFDSPRSAGPYKVESWTPDLTVFVENENYHRYPMAIQRIEIVNVPDSQSRVLQLSAGEIDIAYGIPLAVADSLPSEVRQSIDPVGGVNWVWVNTAREPFDDVRVRQAISLAIDRDAVSELAFLGSQPPSTSLVHDCGELCEPNLLLNEGKQDLDRARELLAEAGLADGFSTTIMSSSTRAGWSEAAVIIAENLREIGIDASVEKVDDPTVGSNRSEGTYDLIFFGGAGTPQVLLTRIMTADGVFAQHANYDPGDEAEALVAAAAVELDPDARRDLFTEIQVLANDHMHLIPVVDRIQFTGWRTPENVTTMIPNRQLIRVASVEEAS